MKLKHENATKYGCQRKPALQAYKPTTTMNR